MSAFLHVQKRMRLAAHIHWRAQWRQSFSGDIVQSIVQILTVMYCSVYGSILQLTDCYRDLWNHKKITASWWLNLQLVIWIFVLGGQVALWSGSIKITIDGRLHQFLDNLPLKLNFSGRQLNYSRICVVLLWFLATSCQSACMNTSHQSQSCIPDNVQSLRVLISTWLIGNFRIQFMSSLVVNQNHFIFKLQQNSWGSLQGSCEVVWIGWVLFWLVCTWSDLWIIHSITYELLHDVFFLLFFVHLFQFVILVIDSTDRERLHISKEELYHMLANEVRKVFIHFP